VFKYKYLIANYCFYELSPAFDNIKKESHYYVFFFQVKHIYIVFFDFSAKQWLNDARCCWILINNIIYLFNKDYLHVTL